MSQSTLAAQVWGPLSLTLTLDVVHDADPPDAIESLDTSVRMGFGLRF